ncbi:sialidase-1 [Pedobacter cryoconitis]|uniref:Sialidase-1 n=1 Tax=Pedobacter cryoconitis TaxID=188932 RepID=A0A7W8ZJR0_9SPHI|nr:SGNH/GDSL hydrolase family protein [Pedobacter cryoconitis]MBB5635162.1 sialidase-1 [Pedobacter cryoconitis]MBB6271654.1 sialidase-1 [Pedobacter cryoconitis]
MRLSYNLIFLLILLSSQVTGQALPDSKKDTWKGFERSYFKINKRSAYTVKPAKALPGNPWVWRSSFPDWHTEMDSLLLVRGFHIAYVHADDEYGSPADLQIWDEFYAYVTDSLKLSSKPALEAVSRGALYAIGWAKRNPGKVSCIYAETPVYDFKSWPGGKGKGPGDADSWKQLKKAYHFTEQQALEFSDNPIDHLDGLAAFKIPVLNVIGINDRLAPREENLDIFVHRYTYLGGPALVYPITDGPQEMNGHHIPIHHADRYADFIVSNSYPVKNILPYSDYFKVRNGLTNFYQTVKQQKKATVAFAGGSITYNPGWRQKVCNYLMERFPKTQFHFISAGIPSLGSLPHAFRLQRDVLDSGKVDLLFVEAAVNDRVNRTDSLTQLRSLEGIILHAKKSNPFMDIMLMEFADPDKNQDYQHQLIPVEIANHERIAAHYNLPSINLAKEVYEKIKNKEFNWEDDFKDLHPSYYGQELYFATIKSLLNTCFNQSAALKQTGSLSQKASLTYKKAILPKELDKNNFSKGSYQDIKNAHYDVNWKIDKNWTPSDQKATRAGFVNVPVLSSAHPGSSLSLSFEGNAIGIAVISGPDAGIITYAIDGSPKKQVDLFTQWSNSLHLPWYVLLGSGLKKGSHVLNISIDKNKNSGSQGNACRIVYFLKN